MGTNEGRPWLPGMGSNIIEATNLVERLFGIVAVLFAIITFSQLGKEQLEKGQLVKLC